MQYIKYYLCPQLLDVRDGDGVWPQLIHKVSKRALISNETRLWPNGIVYYKIDAQFTGIHEYSTYIYIYTKSHMQWADLQYICFLCFNYFV